MSKLNLQLLSGTALAAALATSAATPAFAVAGVTGIYGGGSTFQEKVIRDIMNCYGSQSGGELAANLPNPPGLCAGQPAYDSTREGMYSGEGSGRGLNSWKTNDPAQFNIGRVPDNPPVSGSSDLGSFYGVGVGTSWIGVDSTGHHGTTLVGTAPVFPEVNFGASDDPIDTGTPGSTAYDTYQTNSAAHGWGPALQLPVLMASVALGYTPAVGNFSWTEKGKTASGNFRHLDLRTTTWCGIMTGQITDWNSSEITQDNGNVSITGNHSAPINVVYRNDGSGTTFILANALLHQCGTDDNHTAAQTHPVPHAWATSGGNTEDGSGNGLSNNSWFLNLGPGHAAILPAAWVGGAGNGGVKAGIIANPGFVGYVSADFTQLSANHPDPTGVFAANLQTWRSFADATTIVWKAPTWQNAVKALTWSSTELDTHLKPPSFAGGCGSLDEGCATDPLAWGKTNPAPHNTAAYPLAGYTFLDTYTCFDSFGTVAKLFGDPKVKVGVVHPYANLGYVRWYFGSSTENGNKVKPSLNANQFAPDPSAFLSAVKKLLITNKPTAVGVAGVSHTLVGGSLSCEGLSGGAH